MKQEQWIRLYEKRYKEAKTLQDISDIDTMRFYDKHLTLESLDYLQEVSTQRVFAILGLKKRTPEPEPTPRRKRTWKESFKLMFIGNKGKE